MKLKHQMNFKCLTNFKSQIKKIYFFTLDLRCGGIVMGRTCPDSSELGSPVGNLSILLITAFLVSPPARVLGFSRPFTGASSEEGVVAGEDLEFG